MYNWLSHGIVGNSVCRTWESCTLAFPCAVNRVIHDSIACYAHFHDACLLVFGFFGADRAVLWNEVEKIGKAKNALFQVQGEETADRSRANPIHSGERLSQRRDERQDHNPDKDMERRIHQADRREENAQSAVSCIERGSERSGENQKERLQYLAAGTAGTATPQKTGYGEITDRAAG